MNAKDSTPSQELHSREALAPVFAELKKYDATTHFVGGAPTVMTSTNDVASTKDQTRLVIVGATGMVGGYALRYAPENPAVGCATAIGRRKLGISHPKLKEVLHQCSTT